MIYKINMMSGQGIILESEEELTKLLHEANEGKKLVLTKHGVVNIASIDSIVEHKEVLDSIRELVRYGKTPEQARIESLPPSPFAKLLGEKMTMLSPRSRSIAQEEGARETRKK